MWFENLRRMKEDSGCTTKEIAEKSGVPEPTLEKLFAGQTKEPKISTLRQLVHFFGHTLDELYEDKKSPSTQIETLRLASRIERLKESERGAVSALISYYESEAEPATKVIPFVIQSMAAGSGEPDFGNIALEKYEVPADSKAEFACRAHGDSLEPYYHDHDIVLALKRDPDIGEVGVFIVDGEYKIKQYVEDNYGNVYLFAVNRARSDTDQILWAKDEHTLDCLGTVIMPKRIPIPS